MHNCIITGCGRSGTSMVAGLLARSGYFFGDELFTPRTTNPKGFFEGETIKAINEDLLKPVVKSPPRGPARYLFAHRTEYGSRWLSRVPVGVQVSPDAALARRMQEETTRTPFAYKDPRFCYTLGAWRRYLPADTVFVCAFREPGRTVTSILKERAEAPYLSGLWLSRAAALRLWTLMYRHVLEVHGNHGKWLFLHYEQVLRGVGVARLAEHVAAPADPYFADPSLKRSSELPVTDKEAMAVYEQLCARAGYTEPQSGTAHDRLLIG